MAAGLEVGAAEADGAAEIAGGPGSDAVEEAATPDALASGADDDAALDARRAGEIPPLDPADAGGAAVAAVDAVSATGVEASPDVAMR